MHEACIIAYKASCKVIQNNRNRRKKRRDYIPVIFFTSSAHRLYPSVER